MANIRRQAAIDLAKKLRLENQAQKNIAKLFRAMAEDMRSEYARNGTIINSSDYLDQFYTTLLEQARRVSKAFKRSFRDSHGLKSVKQIDDNEINLRLKEFNQTRSRKAARLISDSNQLRLELAVKAAIEKLTKLDEAVVGDTVGAIVSAPSFEDVAKEAAKIFKSHAPNWAALIATTETQTIAERSKLIEIDVTMASDEFQELVESEEGKEMVKTWVSVGDDKVRESHIEADGSKRRADEPFQVGGYQLMIPADDSLGAPLGEVINCRCSAVYDFEEI